ncbi:RNA polymerase sigma factor [Aliiglaciecola sp. 2_MG-2023]|uniref:RNA polymerase sigma factor n=1 Tax=unclassified Aliiglaciecola TaxID=2593648 RepID=UPI0026E31B82|nr:MULTISPECIES: RNA polymerase sigma factor [unclassified Aliiglaciecola]MDO6712146.1 RNA polymerase sigma factor [Aliiglaciecola sp. 2_MG-2023]MDO6753226.1 RNA polymerase sigma factor [Aliiglaciecola sp. 1_MG-2023]
MTVHKFNSAMIEQQVNESDLPEQQRALISELFTQHNEILLRFLRARLQSDADAHEVAQEAYVKLLDLDKPGAVSYLRSYLFKVASNLAIDRLRAKQTAVKYQPLLFFDEESPSAEQEAIVNERVQLVSSFISELPPKCRKAFLLSRYHGLSSKQISNVMRISDRMVRKYLVRATEHCKMRLQKALESSE